MAASVVRLAGAGRAGHQHQAARLERRAPPKIFGVQLSCFECQDLARNGPEHGARTPRFWLKALTRKRDRPWISNEKSTLQRLLVGSCAASRSSRRRSSRGRCLWSKQRIDIDAAHVTMHPDHGRQARPRGAGPRPCCLHGEIASSWVMSMVDQISCTHLQAPLRQAWQTDESGSVARVFALKERASGNSVGNSAKLGAMNRSGL